METALKKNAKGYNYTYTDLTQIHEFLESNGWRYYQYIEEKNGVDYIFTVKIDENGNESKPLQGCRIINATLKDKSNPAQEQGSAITYARRYSLLMAYGLTTTDDDAQCMTTTDAEIIAKINACKTNEELDAIVVSLTKEQANRVKQQGAAKRKELNAAK